MSVSVQGSTVDPHAIPDQGTQKPKLWKSVRLRQDRRRTCRGSEIARAKAKCASTT